MSEGSWWGQKIPAGQTCLLDFNIESTLIVNNACLGEFDEKLTEPVKLTASVKTLNSIDDEPVDESNEVTCDYYEDNVTLCNLVPHKAERAEISFCFTFMNSVAVTNHGKADVFLSGRLEAVDDFEYDYFEEEEEEEEEEAKEETKEE